MPKDDVQFITWAKETGMTDTFWDTLVASTRTGEAWVCIWKENLGTKQFQDGVDMLALANAYRRLTGRPFPASIPSPSPIPNPIPIPSTPDPSNNPGCSKALAQLFGGHK